MTNNIVSINGKIAMDIADSLDKIIQAEADKYPLTETEVLAGLSMAVGRHMLRTIERGTSGTSDQGLWEMHANLVTMVVNGDMSNIKTTVMS